ncbi:hypothetical protein D3C87_1366660 [compost metagenome]
MLDGVGGAQLVEQREALLAVGALGGVQRKDVRVGQLLDLVDQDGGVGFGLLALVEDGLFLGLGHGRLHPLALGDGGQLGQVVEDGALDVVGREGLELDAPLGVEALGGGHQAHHAIGDQVFHVVVTWQLGRDAARDRPDHRHVLLDGGVVEAALPL